MLNYVGVATPTPADITAAAKHMVNFLDMGGHEKYLKTTLYGMTCLLPGRYAGVEVAACARIAQLRVRLAIQDPCACMMPASMVAAVVPYKACDCLYSLQCIVLISNSG